MSPSDKSKRALLLELETLRSRIADLEEHATEREGRFQSLFNQMTEGFALHEIICDEKGQPCDYRFLETSPAFERLTGLKRNDVIGKTVREILPEIEPHWITTYGAVALTGQPVRFENYSAPLKRHYECFAYSPAPRQFVVLFTDITERKRAEEALRESRDDLNRAQAVAHIGSWRLDVRRDELLWSDETYRMFGIPKGTPLTYEAFIAAVHPEDREFVDQKWNAALRGEPYDIEHRIVVEGNLKWVRERAELEFDHEANLRGGFGTVQDITELKGAEEALRQAKGTAERHAAELKTIFDSINDPVLVYDANGALLQTNVALKKFYGLDPDGTGWDKQAEVFRKFLAHYPDGRLMRQKDRPVARALQGETVRNEVIIVKDQAGRETAFSLSSSPIIVGGKITGAVSVNRDITELKRAEDAILRAKEEWEKTFDTVPDLMAILDQHHRVVRVNKAMANRLGVAPEQCIGLRCHEAVHGSPHPPEFCPHALTCQDGKEHVSEVHEPRLGGDFLVSTTPLCDGHGKLIGSIHVARDITERKQAEDQIKKSLKEKEVLLKEIHHRVKNNLQIIHSMLNLQMPYVKDEQAIALFKESRDRVFSMALVHEKLYQSKSLARIDLPDYIQKIAANLFNSYGVSERTVALRIDVEDISLDAHTVIPCALIINELVSNSLKYAFPGSSVGVGVKGEVRIDLLHDIDNKYILTVSDNGVGLPDGFDIQNSETLGLQLVSVLVKQLNGSIQIRAVAGAEFKITFEAGR
ncbi:PAS domain S-box protein [Candidatus Poribacteria bacterium]|nr:PAS domain S-box protein [Candidatus Poribacteria bacterium]